MKQTYQAPSEETAGIRNLVLIYNGYYEQNRGNWMPEEFLPYLLYQRRDGSFSERFFDGFLLKPLTRSKHQPGTTGTGTWKRPFRPEATLPRCVMPFWTRGGCPEIMLCGQSLF